jgi:hypothetical protein
MDRAIGRRHPRLQEIDSWNRLDDSRRRYKRHCRRKEGIDRSVGKWSVFSIVSFTYRRKQVLDAGMAYSFGWHAVQLAAPSLETSFMPHERHDV